MHFGDGPGASPWAAPSSAWNGSQGRLGEAAGVPSASLELPGSARSANGGGGGNFTRDEELAKLEITVLALTFTLAVLDNALVLLTLPDNFSDCKQKKKVLVKKVQAFLAQCDTVEGSIGQEMDKLQSKNMTVTE